MELIFTIAHVLFLTKLR